MQAAGLSLTCCEGCARPPRLAGHECSATSEGDVSVWRALCSCISFRVSFWTAHMWGWSTICCGGAAASPACPCAVSRLCVNTFVAVAVCVLRQSNLPAGALLAFGGPSTVSQAGAAEPNLWLSHLADGLLLPCICSVCEAVCISKAALSFHRVAAACLAGCCFSGQLHTGMSPMCLLLPHALPLLCLVNGCAACELWATRCSHPRSSAGPHFLVFAAPHWCDDLLCTTSP